MKKNVWLHKKYGKRQYSGSYHIDDGDREFILVAIKRDGKKHRVTFESHEAAKKLGWFKK